MLSSPLLATKLYVPPLRPSRVPRPRLIRRLNEGLTGKLILISAPAGYGKTTLVSEWLLRKDEGGRTPAPALARAASAGVKDETFPPSSFISHPSRVAWLSLDKDDNDPIRFLTYLIASLATLNADIGESTLAQIQSPQPPPTETTMAPGLTPASATS